MTNVNAQPANDADRQPGNTTAETHWTTSKWPMEELDRKKIEFRVPMPDGLHTKHGLGQLWVRRNPRGLLAIEIVTDEPGQNQFERVQTRTPVPQLGVDRLEKHPDPAVAAFRLFFV